MESLPRRSSTRISPTVALAGALLLAPAQGGILVSLSARDFQPDVGIWPQDVSAPGLPGSFSAFGTPILREVGGTPAVVFDGGDDYFAGPATTAALHGRGAPHTVSVWAFQGNVRAQESLVSWGHRGGPEGTFAGFRFGSSANEGAVARWSHGDLGFESAPAPGRWHHLVFAYDGKFQFVYVDGELEVASEIGPVDPHDGYPILIGAERNFNNDLEGPMSRFSGALRSVRIHDRCLTASEVRKEFAAQKGDAGKPDPTPPRALPLHRFSLGRPDGPAPDGTRVRDRLGGVSATVRGQGARFRASGLQLAGGDSRQAPYLDLPNGIVSAHRNVTLELWSTQFSPGSWTRLISVGRSTRGEISTAGGSFAGDGTLSLCTNVGRARVCRLIRQPNDGPTRWRQAAPYHESAFGTPMHDALVYDAGPAHWFWYRNGVLQECLPDFDGSSALSDLNVWLGRSEFSGDENFTGEISEVRIYNMALREEEIVSSFLAGPGILPGTLETRHFRWQPATGGSFSFRNSDRSDHWGTGRGGAHPDGAGTVATVEGDAAAPLRIALDEPVTLGTLHLARPGLLALESRDEGGLIFDSGHEGAAALIISPQCRGGSVSLPLRFDSRTEVVNLSPRPFELSGRLRGSQTLSKAGFGPVIVAGSLADYEGSLEVRRGDLILTENAPVDAARQELRVLPAGRAIFDSSADVEITSKISGGGYLAHRGPGRLTVSSTGTLANAGSIVVEDTAGAFNHHGTIDGARSLMLDGHTTLHEGSTTWVRDRIVVGFKESGHVRVTGSSQVALEGLGHLIVGDSGAGLGTLALDSGSLRCRELHLGRNDRSSGILTLRGGLMDRLPGGGDSRIGGAHPGAANSWGALVVRGGVFRGAGATQIGAYGKGLLTLTGGETHLQGHLVLGKFQNKAGHRGTGLADISGGSLTLQGEDHLLIIGDEGEGALTIRKAGRVTCASALVGAGTPGRPGSGVISILEGGELAVTALRQINRSAATGILYLDGGVLRARASSDDFVSQLDGFWLGPKGATLDTGEFNIAVATPITGSPGAGVSRIPVEAGGSGYSVSPQVTLRGGGGHGASAVAQVREGEVTAILVTCPGGNYSAPPRVEVTGDGRGLVAGPPTLAPHPSGGLAKTGTGRLFLPVPCPFAGPLLVKAGTLTTGPMFSGGRGGLIINDGAAWSGSGFMEGSVSLARDATLQPDADGGVSIAQDLHLRGSLELATADVTGQFLSVQGTLILDGARLNLASPPSASSSEPIVIARYGSLRGSFENGNALPNGWGVDYQFRGANEIALIRSANDTDAP